MSSAIAVPWSKMSFPSPTAFLTFVNVRRTFSPDWMSSSSTPATIESLLARSPTCSAVTPADAPVDLMTASVSCPTLTASRASESESPRTRTAPSPTKSPVTFFAMPEKPDVIELERFFDAAFPAFVPPAAPACSSSDVSFPVAGLIPVPMRLARLLPEVR
jgi:hypothetical protein